MNKIKKVRTGCWTCKKRYVVATRQAQTDYAQTMLDKLETNDKHGATVYEMAFD